MIMHALISDDKEAVLRKQKSLYRAAREMPEGERFKRLFGILKWEPWLRQAARQVLSNRGSKTPGIDGVTKRQFRTKIDAELGALIAEIKTGTYKPMPVKRIYIPKPGKEEKRPLGIPTIRDRIIQKAVQMILDPIYEAKFEGCSYGFRPNRNCMDAVWDIFLHCRQQTGYEWIIEGDIRDCFGTISHRVLMKALRERIADKRLLNTIDLMLKAGVIENLRHFQTKVGTPQGNIVSPLLANVVLNQFDRWFANRWHQFSPGQRARRYQKGLPTARLIRYADDWVIVVRGTQLDAETIREDVAKFIATDLHMELNHEKTVVTHIAHDFDFLGFHFRQARRAKDGGLGLYIFPNKKAIQSYKEKIRSLTQRNLIGAVSVDETIARINWVVRGWGNYFRYVNSKRTYSYLSWWTWKRLYQYLCKKHPKIGRKKVYQKYMVPVSKARQQYLQRRKGRSLGVPLGDGWLVLDRMDYIRIQRYKRSIRNIPPPYDAMYTEPGRELSHLNSFDVNINFRAKEPEWRLSRLEALKRDGHRCVICGSTENLNVHHRIPREIWPSGKPGVHAPENLETRCYNCHQDTHYPNRT
jgi:RNA-directed DNA polymerase